MEMTLMRVKFYKLCHKRECVSCFFLSVQRKLDSFGTLYELSYSISEAVVVEITNKNCS